MTYHDNDEWDAALAHFFQCQRLDTKFREYCTARDLQCHIFRTKNLMEHLVLVSRGISNVTTLTVV